MKRFQLIFLFLLLLAFEFVPAQGTIREGVIREGVLTETGIRTSTGMAIPLHRQEKTFGQKLLRAEIISFSMQAVGYGALAAMPQDFTHWNYSSVGENYTNAWTKPPVFDEDSWVFNWLGHPLTGALHYNALRSQGVPALHSFAYSTAQSFIWEYMIECLHERPSIQDLAITSTIGSILGEIIHRGTLGMRKNGFRTYEKIIVTIINPTYVINNGYR